MRLEKTRQEATQKNNYNKTLYQRGLIQQYNIDFSDTEWGKYTYNEIIQMEKSGTEIPEDILNWAHAQQQEADSIDYLIIDDQDSSNKKNTSLQYITLEVSDPKWAQYSYEEIIQMEENGVKIPEEVLKWAHSQQQEDAVNYIIITDTNIAEDETLDNSANVNKLRSLTISYQMLTEEALINTENLAEEYKYNAQTISSLKNQEEELIKKLENVSKLTEEWKVLNEKEKQGRLTKSEKTRYKELNSILSGENNSDINELKKTSAEIDTYLDSLDILNQQITKNTELSQKSLDKAKQFSELDKNIPDTTGYNITNTTKDSGTKNSVYSAKDGILALNNIESAKNLEEYTAQISAEIEIDTDEGLIDFADEYASAIEVATNTTVPTSSELENDNEENDEEPMPSEQDSEQYKPSRIPKDTAQTETPAAPTDTDEVPAEAGEIPTETGDASAEAEEVPTETDVIPTETDVVSIEVGEVPTKSGEATTEANKPAEKAPESTEETDKKRTEGAQNDEETDIEDVKKAPKKKKSNDKVKLDFSFINARKAANTTQKATAELQTSQEQVQDENKSFKEEEKLTDDITKENKSKENQLEKAHNLTEKQAEKLEQTIGKAGKELEKVKAERQQEAEAAQVEKEKTAEDKAQEASQQPAEPLTDEAGTKTEEPVQADSAQNSTEENPATQPPEENQKQEPPKTEAQKELEKSVNETDKTITNEENISKSLDNNIKKGVKQLPKFNKDIENLKITSDNFKSLKTNQMEVSAKSVVVGVGTTYQGVRSIIDGIAMINTGSAMPFGLGFELILQGIKTVITGGLESAYGIDATASGALGLAANIETDPDVEELDNNNKTGPEVASNADEALKSSQNTKAKDDKELKEIKKELEKSVGPLGNKTSDDSEKTDKAEKSTQTPEESMKDVEQTTTEETPAEAPTEEVQDETDKTTNTQGSTNTEPEIDITENSVTITEPEEPEENTNTISASATANASANVTTSTDSDDKADRKLTRFNEDSVIESKRKRNRVTGVKASAKK